MVGIYDRIATSSELEELLAVEALTNPRVYEEAGDLRKTRPEDRITGPGATPIMASFAYTGPSRFSDGTFGVYYAAHDDETAIAESLYHTEKRLREWREPSIDVDKRIYAADVRGRFDDVRARKGRGRMGLSDPSSYAASQRYARRLYEKNELDGVVYRSVRRLEGECVAVFRPRSVSNCRVHRYVQFRWDGRRIVAVVDLANIRRYEL